MSKGEHRWRGKGVQETFATAEAMCKGWGYRLCTLEEVHDGELGGLEPSRTSACRSLSPVKSSCLLCRRAGFASEPYRGGEWEAHVAL